MTTNKSNSHAYKLCYDCSLRSKCNFEHNNCPLFTPPKSQIIMEKIMPVLKKENVASDCDYIPLDEYEGDCECDCTSKEWYYMDYIYQCIDTISSKRVAYVYSISQIKEILRYVPDAEVSYHDGVYYVHQK